MGNCAGGRVEVYTTNREQSALPGFFFFFLIVVLSSRTLGALGVLGHPTCSAATPAARDAPVRQQPDE